MERFRVEVSYPTSKSGFWWKIRYGLAKLLLGKGYFHESSVITAEDLEELKRQNFAYYDSKEFKQHMEQQERWARELQAANTPDNPQ